MQTIPIIPVEIKITPNEIFNDTEKADRWYKSHLERIAAISAAIIKYRALKFSDPDIPERFQIISPSTKGYRYQITSFDKDGPVYDSQKNDPEEIAKEVNKRYILKEII